MEEHNALGQVLQKQLVQVSFQALLVMLMKRYNKCLKTYLYKLFLQYLTQSIVFLHFWVKDYYNIFFWISSQLYSHKMTMMTRLPKLHHEHISHLYMTQNFDWNLNKVCLHFLVLDYCNS